MVLAQVRWWGGSVVGPAARTEIEGAVRIDIGPARVMVGRGVDPRSLALVLAALLEGAAR